MIFGQTRKVVLYKYGTSAKYIQVGIDNGI